MEMGGGRLVKGKCMVSSSYAGQKYGLWEDYGNSVRALDDSLTRALEPGLAVMKSCARQLRVMAVHALGKAAAECIYHWYNHDTKKIEFRPLGSQWNGLDDNWELSQHESLWRLTRTRNLSLLAPSSRSVCHIADILSPLDTVLNLHMIIDANTGVLEIKVPSLQLDFLLICGESAIRSRQFRGMKIDANQSIDTLVGFKSKLIMLDTHNPENRMAIIPEGEISLNKHANGHIRAAVTYGTASRIQRYSIDNQLRRLVDNATITSKLYLAYIHAFTSYCVPDPFLGRTGTEVALSILGSAPLRSVDCLTEIDVRLLQDIAALTPGRKFYPEHLITM